jgi:hypothetical protein
MTIDILGAQATLLTTDSQTTDDSASLLAAKRQREQCVRASLKLNGSFNTCVNWEEIRTRVSSRHFFQMWFKEQTFSILIDYC